MSIEEDTVEFAIPQSFAAHFFARPQPDVRLHFGAASHVGCIRTRNEDQYAIVERTRSSEMLLTSLPERDWQFQTNHSWSLLVADGIGGAARGDVASALAVQKILELSAQATSWVMKITDLDAQEVRRRVEAYVERIQQEFHERVASEPQLQGMGTTITTAIIMPPDVLFVHVGDSRAYMMRGGHLQQITRDQTLAQEMLDAGAKPDDVRSFRHLLTNSLGSHRENVNADVFHAQTQPGDRMLLCSDGLSDMIEDDVIRHHLVTTEEPQAVCDSLVQAAIEAGGKDNITVVVCDVHKG